MASNFGVDPSFAGDCLETWVLAASVFWVVLHSTMYVPLTDVRLNICPCPCFMTWISAPLTSLMAAKAQSLRSVAHRWRGSSCSGTMFCILPYRNPSSALAVRWQLLSFQTLGCDSDVLCCCEIRLPTSQADTVLAWGTGTFGSLFSLPEPQRHLLLDTTYPLPP